MPACIAVGLAWSFHHTPAFVSYLSVQIPVRADTATLPTLERTDYQSDVYTKSLVHYYPFRGLAVLGEGCRGVLN
jgi:hypothetical protein